MAGPIDGILFDIDGTLIETLEIIVQAMNAALTEVGEGSIRSDEIRPLIGMPVPRQMRILRGLDGPVLEEITDRYYVHFAALVEKGVRLYPGVRETLAALADRPIGTMTTRRRPNAQRMLEVGGLAPYFRAIVGGDEVPRPKPNPDLPLRGAESIRVPPDRCVVVGDAPVDILAGRAAGMRTVAVRYGYGDPEEIRKAEPHATVGRFAELPRVFQELGR